MIDITSSVCKGLEGLWLTGSDTLSLIVLVLYAKDSTIKWLGGGGLRKHQPVFLFLSVFIQTSTKRKYREILDEHKKFQA